MVARSGSRRAGGAEQEQGKSKEPVLGIRRPVSVGQVSHKLPVVDSPLVRRQHKSGVTHKLKKLLFCCEAERMQRG